MCELWQSYWSVCMPPWLPWQTLWTWWVHNITTVVSLVTMVTVYVAWCHPNCENRGYCVKPDKCICPKGYTGSRCHKGQCNSAGCQWIMWSCFIATCYPECKNGGMCVKVGVCQCVPPYFGARCEQRGILSVATQPVVLVRPTLTFTLHCPHLFLATELRFIMELIFEILKNTPIIS